MKLLLIQPPKAEATIGGEDFPIYEPLGLEYVAAGVTDHHDVRILDMRLDPDAEGAIRSFEPDVVGITSCTVDVNTVKRLSCDIKALRPETFTVVGGHHATVAASDFFVPDIDLVVSGEYRRRFMGGCAGALAGWSR